MWLKNMLKSRFPFYRHKKSCSKMPKPARARLIRLHGLDRQRHRVHLHLQRSQFLSTIQMLLCAVPFSWVRTKVNEFQTFLTLYSSFCRNLKRLKSLTYLDIHGGYISQDEQATLQAALGHSVQINKFKFSSIARPAVGQRKYTIWGLRMRY